MTPGQAAYEEFQRMQSRKVSWDILDTPGRERWELIAQAAINANTPPTE